MTNLLICSNIISHIYIGTRCHEGSNFYHISWNAILANYFPADSNWTAVFFYILPHDKYFVKLDNFIAEGHSPKDVQIGNSDHFCIQMVSYSDDRRKDLEQSEIL